MILTLLREDRFVPNSGAPRLVRASAYAHTALRTATLGRL